jgi:protein-tyrosine phosphatase
VSFVVLYVCTGNVCRSPLAERLLRAQLAQGSPIYVQSAGTGALEGLPMDPPSAQALRELGGDDSGHVARWLTDDMIARADLVLGATRLHRDRVLQAVPSALHRTFTMTEFARLGAPLVGTDRSVDPTDAVAAVAARRGRSEPVPAEDDDIADPFRQPIEQARACAAEITRTVRSTLGLLSPATRSRDRRC